MIIRGAVLREMGLPQPYAESRPLRTEQVELAPPGPGELLVRVRAAGLCHSDLSVIDGSRPRVMPMLLGHEATGEVVRSEALGFAPGDTVGFAFVPACGGCGPCAEGRAALCEPGAAANTAGTLLGGAQRLDGVHHHLGVSGFADHAVVSARSAVKIDPSLPPEIAALFGCAVMTGVGAVVNTARIQPGQSAVVFGLGGVGLAALLGAVLAGAHPIVAVDVVPEKLALATSLGATTAIDARPTESSAAPTAAPSEVSPNAAIPSGAGPSSGALNAAIPSGAGPSDDARTVTSQSEPASSAAAPRTAAPTAAAFDVVEAVREATAGGADYAFETVGSAAVLGQAYAATRRGGTTVTVGLPHPYQLLSIPAVSLVAEERTLKGSYLGSAVPSRDIPRYIALYRAGRLPVDRLLTSTVSLDGLNEAFDELAAGTSIRQVLVF